MIIIIDGPEEAAMAMAQNLRSAQISKGQGALIVNTPTADGDHDIREQLDKILDNQPFPADRSSVSAAELRWKSSPMILVPASREPVLKQIEELVPGFGQKFGPVSRMTVG